MDIEETISNKKTLTGYSSKSVAEYIQSLQEKYQKEIKNLKEKLLIEKEMNQKLQVEVELKQSISQNTRMEQEIKTILEDVFEQHVVHTKSILDFQNELKEQEFNYIQELELKKQQKLLAKERLQEALQYFKVLPGTQIEVKKVQIK
ncbi:hypothetical protein C7437_101168 [Psychrobacillus insolitus]|uniref:Uncharacterized protein n=1 Tax=Psychrobacillus insolitus TaxID=1461 RepID=A0A2W7MTB5_9BACI|nr:hypothetical protein [Psychrobacillus insolitus]PZX07061.1 hypothetical protein C7437_101168 [Psychrobacillus insolitus]